MGPAPTKEKMMTEEEMKAWDKAEGYLNLVLAFAVGFCVGLFSHVG